MVGNVIKNLELIRDLVKKQQHDIDASDLRRALSDFETSVALFTLFDGITDHYSDHYSD